MIVAGTPTSLVNKATRMIGTTRVIRTSLTRNSNGIDSINSQIDLLRWMTVAKMHPHLISTDRIIGSNVHISLHTIVILEAIGSSRTSSNIGLLLIEMEPTIGNTDRNIIISKNLPLIGMLESNGAKVIKTSGTNLMSSSSHNSSSGLLSSVILSTNGFKEVWKIVTNLSRISSLNAIVAMIGTDLGSNIHLIAMDAVTTISLRLILMDVVTSSSPVSIATTRIIVIELPTKVLLIVTEGAITVMAQIKACNLLVIEERQLVGLLIKTAVQRSFIELRDPLTRELTGIETWMIQVQ
jgi:hypothetical protein